MTGGVCAPRAAPSSMEKLMATLIACRLAAWVICLCPETTMGCPKMFESVQGMPSPTRMLQI